jgi:antirestriction protein ArdC
VATVLTFAVWDGSAGLGVGIIAGWLKALKDDKKLLVFAAAQGQKASDWIIGKQEQAELDEAA